MKSTMKPLLAFYVFWLIVSFILITGIVPNYVSEEYRDVTIHIITFGFVLITLASRFYYKYQEGTLTWAFIVLFILTIAAFAVLISGAYYWINKYFGREDEYMLMSNILIGVFTVTLVFINLYEQEYSETFYKAGEIVSMIGGKRKFKH